MKTERALTQLRGHVSGVTGTGCTLSPGNVGRPEINIDSGGQDEQAHSRADRTSPQPVDGRSMPSRMAMISGHTAPDPATALGTAEPHEPRFIYAIGALDRSVRRRLGEVLEPFSLTIAEYTALSLLRRRGGYSNAELAKKALVSPQAMNEVIRSLERRHILERTPSTLHGSILNTFLTESGRELLERCDTVVDRMESSMLEGIPGDARTQVITHILQCIHNLQS